MTEAVWVSGTDSTELIRACGSHVATHDRKLRLFAVECWRRVWADQTGEQERRVVELFAGYVDGTVSPGEWFEGFSGAGGVQLPDHIQFLLRPDPVKAATRSARHASGSLGLRRAWAAVSVDVEAPFEQRMRASNQRYEFGARVHRAESEAQCHILRDIFGNPFRPVAFDLAWRTDTAVSLARQMYEGRDFSLMPILADALQDAGCEHPDVLAHCRDPAGTHVRGCWVVDLVLGKQ
jgi:hypothetical protein